MNKLKNIIFSIIILFVLSINAQTSNYSDEEKFVSTFTEEAISILSNDTINDSEKTKAFTSLVMSSIDLPLISKFVLARSWKESSDDQKQRYLIAFKDYFVNSYANKLGQYSGEKIAIIDSEEAGKYVIVNSNIVREGTDTLKINLKWRLLNRDGQIKIIDLNIEGISLIIAQREEFQSFLANNNYDLDKLIEKIISVSN
jgi:phospholipid transport system substrate-binding protein